MQEQTIDIEWNGKSEKVTIKRLLWRERVKLENKMASVSLTGNKPNIAFNSEVYKVNLMLLGIRTAPFPVSEAGLDTLEPEAGDKILDALEKLNTITDKKKESSSGDSNTEPQTVK